MNLEQFIRRSLAFARPFSIAAFALGSLLWIPAASFYSRSQVTSGTVVRMNHEEEVSYPVFAFSDSSGAQHTIESDSGSDPPAYTVGQAISIRYLSTDPDTAHPDDFWSLWGVPVITQIAALMVFAVSFVVERVLRPARGSEVAAQNA